jgi:hypothetical protein
MYRGKYCYFEDASQFIGDTVKIWAEGGNYPGFSSSKSFNWAPDSLRLKCDSNYSPVDGALGIIRFASPILNDRTGIDNIIYIVQIRQHLVAIGCGFIVEKDSLSFGEYERKIEVGDSVANAIYAKGCAFKTSHFQGNYFEAGIHEIDRLSETFACDLKSKKIKTILLIKSFYNNHGLGDSRYIAVFWLEHSKGKLKIFERKDDQVSASGIIEVDFNQVLSYFSDKKIPEITTHPAPSSRLSHDLTFYIQLLYNGQYYLESLTNSEMTGDKAHEKSIWWTMITDLVNANRTNK